MPIISVEYEQKERISNFPHWNLLASMWKKVLEYSPVSTRGDSWAWNKNN